MQNMAAIFMPEFDRSVKSENFQFMRFIYHHH